MLNYRILQCVCECECVCVCVGGWRGGRCVSVCVINKFMRALIIEYGVCLLVTKSTVELLIPLSFC